MTHALSTAFGVIVGAAWMWWRIRRDIQKMVREQIRKDAK